MAWLIGICLLVMFLMVLLYRRGRNDTPDDHGLAARAAIEAESRKEQWY